jgi:uncharacterized protein with LGFP repeats
VLWLNAHGGRLRAAPSVSAASVSVSQPKVIPRVDWGADESLRYDSTGKEIWPPAFYPVQKLIVHHTDTQNNDPDPAATIRSIYYYHAVTQGWGDIGYNFLIDEFGRIYEGRHSQNSWDPATYPSGPTGADANGDGVTAAHAQGFNSGTVGIALLGTLSDHDATPAARDALERLLAWEASAHGIDPQGSALYTNPVSGTRATFPNIAGHRDVNATDCPGAAFYATLPAIRADVAARLAGTASPDVSLNTSVGGSVPATLSLRLGASATFGSFTPGVTKDYTAAITAQVVSTAGAGRLSVADPSADHTGQLVNGRYALPSQLQAKATSLAGHGFAFADVGSGAGPTPLLTYGDPVSNDPVAITFSQHIGATDVLRTGAYAKTLTFTLSTAQP